MTNFNEYTDQDLIDLFSDWYKDVNGFRPRGEYWTRERIVSWMESERELADAQDELKQEMEEDYFLWQQEAARLAETENTPEEEEDKYEQYAYLEEVL